MKHLGFLLLPFSFLLCFCGCSQRSTLTDGRFVVGFDADFPPYGYKDGAEYKGSPARSARSAAGRSSPIPSTGTRRTWS